MKTNFFSKPKNSAYFFVGIFSILMTSCGPSKNASYSDRDGIYGGSDNQRRDYVASDQNYQNNQYKNYFGSLQDQNQSTAIFTDVENYTSTPDNVTEESNKENNSGYSSWGSNADNVNVYVYDNSWNGWNNYWGWNLGYGWNSWYGPYYGWGWDP